MPKVFCTFEWNEEKQEITLQYWQDEKVCGNLVLNLDWIKLRLQEDPWLGYTPSFREVFPVVCDWLKEQGILEH